MGARRFSENGRRWKRGLSRGGTLSMSAPRSACVSLLILIFSPGACSGQSEPASNPTASAWGQVLLAEGDRPIRHARVDFVSSSTGSADSRLTDDKGRFDFEGLAQATYQVVVSAPGYEKLESTVQINGKTGPLLQRLRKTELAASPVNNNVVSVQELKMSDKAEKTFHKGTQLLLKGQAAQSLAYFDRAIANDPAYYRAYHNLGLAHLRLGRTQEAERALQKAIDLTGGGYAPADFAMGLALVQEEDYRRAETVIERGLEVDPGSATGKFYLAMAQFGLNRLEEAERSAEQALWRKGDSPETYFLLAAIHQREHNSPAVTQDLAQYLRLEPVGPHSDEARSLLARTQREMNHTASEAGPTKR
jgi:tetratricopeptide (TPR) repeat protein